jgi:hypothetical protein
VSSATSLRRRQLRKEAEKRDAIAQTAAARASGQTPHLDGTCAECRGDLPTLWQQFQGWVVRVGGG